MIETLRKLSLLPGFKFDKSSLKRHFNLDCDLEKYKEELEMMKAYVLNSNPKQTLYDVLFMKRDKLARYSKNRILLAIYEDYESNFETKFPHYGFWLNLQLQRGLKRRPLVDSVTNKLNYLVDFGIPDWCSENVLKYFNNNFLKEIDNEELEM